MFLAHNVKKLREARGWSQGDLALRAGTSQQNIQRIESGAVRTSSLIPGIAQALNVSVDTLVGFAKVIAATSDDDKRPNRGLPILDGSELIGIDRIPVFASAEGGHGAIILSSDPVDTVKTPTPLGTIKGGYGVIVTGESMVPAFRPGDIALVNPHMPARPEDDILLFTEEHGEARALIKNLVKKTIDKWHLQQWNPVKEFDLSRIEWARCHVVVGKYSRR